jgi:uncharacterized membrane protein HdeD (DUF308 family)
MTPVKAFLLAIGLLALCAVLMKNTSPHSGLGGPDYERRRIRRLLGVLLLVAGTIALGVALIALVLSSGE